MVEIPLARDYTRLFNCRICNKKSQKGRIEHPIKFQREKDKKRTFVCEECLIKNKKGKISLQK